MIIMFVESVSFDALRTNDEQRRHHTFGRRNAFGRDISQLRVLSPSLTESGLLMTKT